MALQRVVRTKQLLLRNVKVAASTAFTASYSSKSVDTDIEGKSKTKDYIGIDVGSSNIYVSTIDQHTNKAKLIHKQPLVIGITAKIVLGRENPADKVYGCKFLFSRKFSDPLIQKEMEKATYKIFRSPNGEAWIQTSYGDPVPPTFIFYSILEHTIRAAERYQGKSVSRAVLAYPAFYSADQLRQMLKVGLKTGLDLIHTIDEPTAVAFAYGMNNKEEGCLFVVIDMGGRTFDVSVLQVSADGRFKFKAPTKSDLFLGGEEFDKALADYLLCGADLSDTTKSQIRKDKVMLRGLRRFAELAKVDLSSAFEIVVRLPLMDGPGGEPSRYFIDLILTRSKFECLVNSLIERIKNHIQSCLKEADITAVDVDEVLLVGGMSRVPNVRRAVCEIFGKSPSRGVTNPDEAVALGAAAAVQAGHFGENPWND